MVNVGMPELVMAYAVGVAIVELEAAIGEPAVEEVDVDKPPIPYPPGGPYGGPYPPGYVGGDAVVGPATSVQLSCRFSSLSSPVRSRQLQLYLHATSWHIPFTTTAAAIDANKIDVSIVASVNIANSNGTDSTAAG